MDKKTVYYFRYYCLFFIILITLTMNQSCDVIGKPILIDPNITTTSPTITFSTQNNNVLGKWTAPGYTTAIITIKGWGSTNGTLIELIFTGNVSEINATIPTGQGGIIRGQTVLDYYGLIVNFAQKDSSHNYFMIQITSKNFVDTVYFTLTLVQRGYNNQDGTCAQTCPKGYGVQFYVDTNGTTNINQFICFQKKIFVSIIGLIVMIFVLF